MVVVFGTLALWKVVQQDAPTGATRSLATGKIVQVERIGVPGGAGQNFVKYRFMAGDKMTTGNEIVEYRAAIPNVGDEIRVSYDAATPTDNYRAPSAWQVQSSQMAKNIGFIVGPIVVLLWVFLLFSTFASVTPRDWLNWRRARGLYRNGEITTGRVQFVRPESALRGPNTGFGAYEIVATYKVEGVRLLATTRCNNVWLVGQLAPEIEVVVAYDPLKPERSVILEPFAF